MWHMWSIVNIDYIIILFHTWLNEMWTYLSLKHFISFDKCVKVYARPYSIIFGATLPLNMQHMDGKWACLNKFHKLYDRNNLIWLLVTLLLIHGPKPHMQRMDGKWACLKWFFMIKIMFLLKIDFKMIKGRRIVISRLMTSFGACSGPNRALPHRI